MTTKSLSTPRKRKSGQLFDSSRACSLCGESRPRGSKDRPRIVTVQIVAYMPDAPLTAGRRLLVCEECIVRAKVGDAKDSEARRIGRALAETLAGVYETMYGAGEAQAQAAKQA